MNRRKHCSHQRTFTQAFEYLYPRYHGPRKEAMEDALIGAKVVALIWRHHQVGIFQLQQKHLRVFWEKRTQHLNTQMKAQYRAALMRMLHELGKDHWRF